MARIPQETIDRVRNAADILDVVSQYVDLRKRGQNYFGLCPFHHEKTPSFSVAPAKEIFHCFGCGAGGNAINFVMDYEKISFVEAIQRLGERYGIEIKLAQDSGSKEFFTHLYDLHELAVSIYHKNLFSEKGNPVLSYLNERGLGEKTLKQFKIGVAFDTWDTLLNSVRKKNVPRDVIEKCGLFSSTEKGTFDRFRNRIMFPIFNTAGKVIAFGGRALDKTDPAKYLNSPDTPLYHKSDIFYGLHATREAIRKSGHVILVEGYMDFLQLYQAGIHNVVAMAGTALTNRHGVQIRKFTDKVTLAYDGDSAGIQAALRAGYLLLRNGVEPSIVRLPEETDPDDIVREEGAKAFLNAVGSAIPVIKFHILVKNASELHAAQRSQFIQEVITGIADISDGIIRDDLLKTLAQDLQVDEQELIKRMQRETGRRRRTPELNQESKPQVMSFTTLVQKAQLELVKILAGGDLEGRQKVRENINLDLFSEPILKQLAEILMPLYDEIDYASIIEQFDSKTERELVTKILMSETEEFDSEQAVMECIRALKSQPLKEKIQQARIRIRELEAAGKDPTDAIIEVAQLRQELNALSS